MNVLSLIFAVLLILALLTQAQLEDFSRFNIIAKEYDKYMETKAREHFNKRQQALRKGGGSSRSAAASANEDKEDDDEDKKK